MNTVQQDFIRSKVENRLCAPVFSHFNKTMRLFAWLRKSINAFDGKKERSKERFWIELFQILSSWLSCFLFIPEVMESLMKLSKALNVGKRLIRFVSWFRFDPCRFDRCCTVMPQGFNSSNYISDIRPHKTRHNVSLLLDKLLDNYNHHLRPDIGGLQLLLRSFKIWISTE
jgi:hypothetical protein